MAISHPTTHPISLDGILDVCPEAFCATDAELNVVEWNRAAESLTGFRRQDVLGGPLPHLPPAQRDDLVAALDTFDDWADEVPLVFPRRHSDGRTIEVCVTAYTRLADESGRPTGFGSFFRAVRATDPRPHARNVYSRALAQSVRRDDVVAAVAMVLQDLLPGDAGYMLTRGPTGWDGSVAIGDHQEVAESIHVDSPSALDEVVRTGIAQLVELPVNGVATPALAVPAGPESAGTVLAMVGEARRDSSTSSHCFGSETVQRSKRWTARCQAGSTMGR